jgi:hypothetical protein
MQLKSIRLDHFLLQVNSSITIWNNGHGVPVDIHKEEKVYVPELIFGHLLTSSNYDDDEKKVRTGIRRAGVCGQCVLARHAESPVSFTAFSNCHFLLCRSRVGAMATVPSLPTYSQQSLSLKPVMANARSATAK